MMQAVNVLVSLLSAALPLVEKYWIDVLPISGRIRDGALPVAVLASLAAVAAGVATARHTGEGVTVGWMSLLLFLVTTIMLYGFMDFVPRAASGLYVLFFATFTLSVSSFLSSRRPEQR
jgi:hypothetical protein